jgi:hypothetical protein
MPIIHIGNSPTFDLEMDAIKQLHENGLCNIIGFKYGSLKGNIQRYNKIHNMKEENIWYHCFDIPRHPRNSCVSHLHELQNWGIDTISPVVKSFSKSQTGYIIMSSRQESDVSSHCNNRFDALTLGLLNEDTWKMRYREDLHCDCSVCKKVQDFNDFKEIYSHELNGNLNTNVLYGATRVHDLFSGSEELTISRKAIESDNLNEYFEGKEFTKGKIKPPQ